MIAIGVAVIALLGVIATAIFAYLGQRQAREGQDETLAQTMAREEIETALSSQGKRLDRIDKDYKSEIQRISDSHTREIAGLRLQYEAEIGELHVQIGLLQTRAEEAETRANHAEAQATESAAHAKKCDAALAELKADHARLRQLVEEKNR